MLNEKKIRLMTRAARYERQTGEADLKINAYNKKDYVSYQTTMTIVWVTVGYAAVVGLIAFAVMEELMQFMSLSVMIILAICVVAGYLAVVLLYGLTASKHYRESYEEARKRVKIFNHDLIRLDRMYEREAE